MELTNEWKKKQRRRKLSRYLPDAPHPCSHIDLKCRHPNSITPYSSSTFCSLSSSFPLIYYWFHKVTIRINKELEFSNRPSNYTMDFLAAKSKRKKIQTKKQKRDDMEACKPQRWERNLEANSNPSIWGYINKQMKNAIGEELLKATSRIFIIQYHFCWKWLNYRVRSYLRWRWERNIS